MSKDLLQTDWKAGVQQKRCQMSITCASQIPRCQPVSDQKLAINLKWTDM